MRFPPFRAPVAFPAGGGFSITWELEQGDPVTLVFCDRDTGPWRNTGSNDTTPQNRERFPNNSAIAIPGGRAPAKPLEAERVDSNHMVFGADPLGKFKFGDNTADKALALAKEVANKFNSFISTYNSHVHVVSGSVTTSGESVAGTAAPTASQESVTSETALKTNRIEVDK